MKNQYKKSRTKATIIKKNFAAEFEKIAADTEIEVSITTSIGELLEAIKGKVVDFAVKYIKRMVPKFELINTVTFSDALKQGKRFTLKDVSRSPDDVVVLQYTGGTTGVSKGAMLTNQNLVANGLQIGSAS